MPLGNGEVGLNLWVEEGGDLAFYISRTDAFSEIARLLKVGKVRLSLTPNPFVAGGRFHQELRLRDGRCEIKAGAGAKQVILSVFVDADQPVVHVLGESAVPLTVKATIESWRTERRALPHEEQRSAWTVQNAPYPLFESADVLLAAAGDSIGWYHRNEESVVPLTLSHQSLATAADKVHDPLIHRTFGGWMTAAGFKAVNDHTLETPAPLTTFRLRLATPCAQTETAEAWVELAKSAAARSDDGPQALRRTAAWWAAFWERSWVFVSGDAGPGVPLNRQPLRIGIDSHGNNRLPGRLGRASLYARALEPKEITALVRVARDQAAPLPTGLLRSWLPLESEAAGYHAEADGSRFDFSSGLTVEAWIDPGSPSPGRIFDKVTAGGTDGFLFDTYPGDTLRLMVGSTSLSGPPGVLKAGAWHHAAATVNTATGALRIYLDGAVVAGRAGDTVSAVTRGYTLQRFVQASGARGAYPIKFNGSIFTVEPKAMQLPFSPDYRNWGDCHWWQNVRLPYYPMLAAGDFEMMDPLFRMYESVRPLCEARARLYHQAEGCYFPETMTVWGTYANGDYGWDRTGHEPNYVRCPSWKYAWNQGPELAALMLDRWDYVGNEEFLRQEVLPMAESVLRYFDTRFKKDLQGRIILDPTQAVETYCIGVTNDAPTVAGLNNLCSRLCALPERLTPPAARDLFTRMRKACPPVPVQVEEHDGQSVRLLAPAEKYVKKTSNSENPELYAVWPFRLYTLGKPGLAEARAAYVYRHSHHDVGWGYDGNCAALLGLTDEAARILRVKAANSRPGYRWPATWGPNFDWLPDQDHGANLLETTQLMLLQADGEQIRLLPAWPKTWDVSFKLHAPRNTVVECVYRHGRIESLQVSPESRRKDIRFPPHADAGS